MAAHPASPRSPLALISFYVLLAVLLPVALAAWLAQIDARARERAALGLYAQRGLARVEIVLANARDALAELGRNTDPPCSTAWRMAAQHAAIKYRYVQETLALDEHNTALCTSLSATAPQNASLGPPAWQGLGHRVWVDLPDPEGAGRKMLLIATPHNAALIDPESLIDVVSDRASFSLGIVGVAHGEVIAAWPYANREALRDGFLQAGERLSDGRFHVVARSRRLPLAVIASEPDETLFERWLESLRYWLPAGLALGGLAAWGVLWLVRRRFSLHGQLRDAIRLRQFEVHYQPIVNLATRRCAGAEALVRWRLPSGELVPPDLFIPLAEATGLIQPITDLVLAAICTELGPTLAQYPGLYVSINVAAEDLATSRFVDVLARQISHYQIRPQQIAIEATERGFMHADAARVVIAALRSAGHPVLIDDFGTGYSGLSYLQSFAVDALKIDKSFVDTVGSEAVSASVAPHIVEMGHSLQLKLIAEGVETEAQAQWLAARGVQNAQGWWFGKAQAQAGFLAYLAAHPPLPVNPGDQAGQPA